MKIYKSQKEVDKDIKDDVLTIKGDVKFECSISIEASIKVVCGDITAGNITARNINAGDITAGNITARNINAGDITAGNINAGNITARNINAGDITAGNINAGDITAGNITARNITARNINAGNISYYAFCCVYNFIKCLSIKAKREKYQEPICLDGKLEIKTKEDDTVEITVEGKTKTISRQSAKELNLI